MKNTISAVLTVVVLIASANSTARWHNPSQGGSSSHGHSQGADHSKMSASEHAMMNMKGMDHSKMTADELLKMKMSDMDHSKMTADELSKMNMSGADHHPKDAHGH
ncbi:hypothetical protein N9Y32_00365 [Candidatus Thioglobus sp.]|nr:hypothetical protein [Candidatus Thioglobus sp.]